MAEREQMSVGELTIGSGSTVDVLMRDTAGKVLMAKGATVPADAGTGYATGCIFLQTDGDNPGSGSGAILNINVGSPTSCNFDPVKS